MLLGVLFALLASLMWGLIFVAPLLVDGYPSALLASGRYLAFGLIVLPFAWQARKRLAALSASDWRGTGLLARILVVTSVLSLAMGPIAHVAVGVEMLIGQ